MKLQRDIPLSSQQKSIYPLSLFLVYGFSVGYYQLFLLGPTLGDFYDNTGGVSFEGIFIIVWLIFWIAGGLFVMKTLMWYLIGKEIITIDREQITIARQNDILFRQKIYDLQEAKRFHVEEEHFEFVFWGQGNGLGLFKNRGTIRFEYGFKTIKFANDMDQAEANHILETLRSSGYLTTTNF